MRSNSEWEWTPHPVKVILIALGLWVMAVFMSSCTKLCDYPEYHYQEWKDGVVVESEYVIFDSLLDSVGVSHYQMMHHSADSDSARLDFKRIKSVKCL